MSHVFPHDTVEFLKNDNTKFTVNGQWIKLYLGQEEEIETIENWATDEVLLTKTTMSCCDVKSIIAWEVSHDF